MQVSRSGARVPQLCIVLTLIALITGCASMAPRATFEEWSQWESSPVPDTWEVEGDETLYDVRVRVFDVEANLLERVVTREGIGELEEFPAPRGDGVARSARITPRQTEHLLRALWRTREANLALSPRLAVLDGQKASCWVGHAPTDAPDAHIGQLWEFEVNGESNGVRLGFGYGIGSQENADYLHRGEHDLAPNEVLLVMLPTPASPEEQFLTPASCVLVTVVPFAP